MDRFRLATISSGIGAVALAAGLTWGVVGAQEPEANTPQARIGRFIERFAQHLGVTTDEAESALKATQLDYVNEAEAAGTLTPEQAARLREHIEEGTQLGVPFALGGLGGPGSAHGRLFPGAREGEGPAFGFLERWGGPGAAVEFGMRELASALGVSIDELRAQLRDGKSIEEIVAASGKTPEHVTDAVLTSARAKLEEQVAAGDLTQAQADTVLERVRPHVLAVLSGDGPSVAPGLGGLRGLTPGREQLERHFQFQLERSGPGRPRLEGTAAPGGGVSLY